MKTDNINAPSTCGKWKSGELYSDAAYSPLVMQIQIGCKYFVRFRILYRDSYTLDAQCRKSLPCIITVMIKGPFSAFVSD